MTKAFLKSLIGSVLDFAAFFGLCYALTHFTKPFAPVLGTSVLSAGLFFIAAYTLATIITESAIAWPFSKLAGKIPLLGPGLYEEDAEGQPSGGLLTCPLCTGMWVGTALAFFGFTIYPVLGMRDLVLHGLLASGGAYFLHKVTERLEK